MQQFITVLSTEPQESMLEIDKLLMNITFYCPISHLQKPQQLSRRANMISKDISLSYTGQTLNVTVNTIQDTTFRSNIMKFCGH